MRGRGGRAGAARFAAGAIAFAVVLVVGATRVYLRAHYLSDVAGGVGLAGAVFSLAGIATVVVAFVRQNGARAP